jgi:flagellar hook-associated protein 3 FlgL
MSMRITQGMMTDRLIGNLGTTQSRLAELQLQAATGSRINKPSDDALGAHDSLRRRDELGQLQGFQDAASDATGWLQTADGALGQITNLLHRVRELTVQGANGATTQPDRNRIATELGAIIDSVKDAANARYGDSYVLAGQDTTTPPYVSGATDTYAGDAGVIARQVGPNTSVQVNTTGGALLGSGGGDGKLLDVLRTIQTNLTSGNTTALTAGLTALDGSLDAVAGARATLGAAQNRVDAAATRLDDLEGLGVNNLSELEDADIAQSLASLSSQQTAYQAALKAGSSLIQPSLMDFLR